MACPCVCCGVQMCIRDRGEADNTFPVVRQSVLFGVLLQGKIEGVQQKLGALPLPALWQKAGQCHSKYLVFIGDGDAVHHTGRFEEMCIRDRSCTV